MISAAGAAAEAVVAAAAKGCVTYLSFYSSILSQKSMHDIQSSAAQCKAKGCLVSEAKRPTLKDNSHRVCTLVQPPLASMCGALLGSRWASQYRHSIVLKIVNHLCMRSSDMLLPGFSVPLEVVMSGRQGN